MADSRDIFRLRREEKHQEAINLARDLFREAPQDCWVIRGYGWCIHDALKAAQMANDTTSMQSLLAEMEGLDIGDGEEDTSLRGARENWRSRLSPEGGGTALAVLTYKAKAESYAGNRQEALRLLREAVHMFPDAPQASTSLAWEIERALKDLVSEDVVDGQAVRRLLQEYARLQHIEKPSSLHSRVLMRATQAAERFRTFIPFLRWWDPANFRADDFQRYTPAGSKHSLDSLVERVIKAIHKASKMAQNVADLEWSADLVGEHYSRFPDKEWFEYYYGQLLVQTGDLSAARELIVPIVRRKKGEFWAWDNLAATCGAEDVELRMACLCRALLCRTKDESFLVNVHAELGALLVELKMYSEARYEIDKAAAIREDKNWTPADEMRRIRGWQTSAWYKSATPLESNEALYNRHATLAEILLYENLPVVPGVVVRHLPPRDHKGALTFVGYAKNGDFVEVAVKTDRFNDLHGTPHGQPLALQVDESGARPVVVSARKRAGESWDVVPSRIGVVRHVNIEKGVTAVALGRDDFCLLHHDRFAEMADAAVGMAVEVKVRRDEKRNIILPLAWEKTAQTPPASFCKDFEGMIEMVDGGRFGFVSHEIYVPAALIKENGLSNGDTIRGLAITELNKKKNEYGWRALTAEKVAP